MRNGDSNLYGVDSVADEYTRCNVVLVPGISRYGIPFKRMHLPVAVIILRQQVIGNGYPSCIGLVLVIGAMLKTPVTVLADHERVKRVGE